MYIGVLIPVPVPDGFWLEIPVDSAPPPPILPVPYVVGVLVLDANEEVDVDMVPLLDREREVLVLIV